MTNKHKFLAVAVVAGFVFVVGNAFFSGRIRAGDLVEVVNPDPFLSQGYRCTLHMGDKVWVRSITSSIDGTTLYKVGPSDQEIEAAELESIDWGVDDDGCSDQIFVLTEDEIGRMMKKIDKK